MLPQAGGVMGEAVVAHAQAPLKLEEVMVVQMAWAEIQLM
jgi:hypothetical protein